MSEPIEYDDLLEELARLRAELARRTRRRRRGPGQIGLRLLRELQARERAIYGESGSGPATCEELAEAISRERRIVHNALERLRHRKLVDRERRWRAGGSPYVYWLTEAGRADPDRCSECATLADRRGRVTHEEAAEDMQRRAGPGGNVFSVLWLHAAQYPRGVGTWLDGTWTAWAPWKPSKEGGAADAAWAWDGGLGEPTATRAEAVNILYDPWCMRPPMFMATCRPCRNRIPRPEVCLTGECETSEAAELRERAEQPEWWAHYDWLMTMWPTPEPTPEEE